MWHKDNHIEAHIASNQDDFLFGNIKNEQNSDFIKVKLIEQIEWKDLKSVCVCVWGGIDSSQHIPKAPD